MYVYAPYSKYTKLWKIERIPKTMMSRAVLLFIFVDRKTIQLIQNDTV